MIVFNAFFKILKEYKGTVLLYTVILLVFSIFNMQTSETSMSFSPEKPDIYIVNHDENTDLTNNLVQYLKKNCHLVSLENDEEKINDAIFYRDVNYVVYIPQHYHDNVLAGQNPTIDIKSTGDYQASLAEMLLERYIKVQNTFVQNDHDVNQIIKNINETLKTSTTVKVKSKVDTVTTAKATFYFNFASYSIMACIIFIICLILSSFKERNIQKRTIVSAMNYKVYNRQLLLASCLYSLVLWLFYVIAGVIIVGNSLLSLRGAIYFLNLFIFTICSLTIALFISSLVEDKNAISGIANVVALGSAFLCGVFVPATWLPDFVLMIAHILPSYWYVNSNDLLKNLEVIHFETLQPVLVNMIVLIGFVVLFIVMNNIISKSKQKIG